MVLRDGFLGIEGAVRTGDVGYIEELQLSHFILDSEMDGSLFRSKTIWKKTIFKNM